MAYFDILFINSCFRLANDMGIVFQSRRFLSQYSVTRALFGVSKTEQQRDEEILNPPPLVTSYHLFSHHAFQSLINLLISLLNDQNIQLNCKKHVFFHFREFITVSET